MENSRGSAVSTVDESKAVPLAGVALAVAAFAVLLSVAAVLAMTVVRDDESGGGGAGRTGSAPVSVELSEFKVTPAQIRVPAGKVVLQVANKGSVQHDLSLGNEGPATPLLDPGKSATLELGDLAPGEYELFCRVPGHADAGMRAKLIVAEGEAAAAGDGADQQNAAGEGKDWAALDKAMQESIARFPAKTKGRGNQILQPRIEGGTKVFELTAEVVDWEVEPGKVVKAWAYNRQVPGPWIKVNVGDRVRIVVHNRLPMGTDVHWHGIQVPNDQDGVAPITQKLIRSGEDFTYEFVTRAPALGMYHAHHHAQMQVPNGLLGLFQVGEVPLPTARTVGGIRLPDQIDISKEIPLVLNDAGVIGYSLNGKSFPATEPITGKVGDWVMVHYANEGLQIHPMHPHQFPQLVIAKDGIPLDSPYWADTLNVAPGERYTVLMHLTDPGTWVWHCHILNHVEREEGMFGMVTAMVVEES